MVEPNLQLVLPDTNVLTARLSEKLEEVPAAVELIKAAAAQYQGQTFRPFKFICVVDRILEEAQRSTKWNWNWPVHYEQLLRISIPDDDEYLRVECYRIYWTHGV